LIQKNGFGLAFKNNSQSIKFQLLTQWLRKPSKLDALDNSFRGTIRVIQQKQHADTKVARVHVDGPFVTTGAWFSSAEHRASYLFARGCIRTDR